MKHKIVFIIGVMFISCNKPESFISDNFKFAERQTLKMIDVMGDSVRYPRTIDQNGYIKYTYANNWTDGFFPGVLWNLYEYTLNPTWKEYALKWTNGLEQMQYITNNHDVGFLMYCSYGNGYKHTKDENMKNILIQSAKSLITRYNNTVKSIESWDGRESWDGKTYWDFPVIIDNMLNLELLYFATKVTGDSIYANVATNHAVTTMKNHFRKDFSTYHVVDYDINTGVVNTRQTCQGFADNSTWSRGQSWAIYGFTMVYRETKDLKFLEIAENAANYYLDNPSLPNDKIPYWDFNVNDTGYIPDFNWNPNSFTVQPRDASSAAITASALFELSEYSVKFKEKFQTSAIEILKTLSGKQYKSKLGENHNFILMHSVGSLPHNVEIDVPLCYADYYYLEALLRYKKLLEKK